MNDPLDTACVMRVEDGMFFLYTPNGEKFPLQKSAVVIQSLDDAVSKIAWARITLLVKLEDSK